MLVGYGGSWVSKERFTNSLNTVKFFGVKTCYAQQELTGKSLIADSVDVSNRQIKEAIEVRQKYIEAVRAGDWKRGRQHWNKEEARRGTIYNIYCSSSERYQMIAKQFIDIVTNASKMGDFIKLTVNWQNEASKRTVFTEILYVVPEDGKLVLAHPLIAMTRDWNRQETKYLIYHYYLGHIFSPRNAAAMDSFVRDLLELFQVKQDRKIAYYIFPPNQDASELKQWGVSGFGLGRTSIRAGFVIDCGRDSEYFPHEITHMIQHYLYKGVPCIFLLEGMATYFGGKDVSKEATLSNLKGSLLNSYVPPVDSLLQMCPKETFTREGCHWVYSVGAAAVGYLFETFGVDKFKQFYICASAPEGARPDPQKFVESLKRIYGLTPSELDEKYRQWLIDKKFERIEFGISRGTRLIAFLRDPVGDDNGDGSYTYPEESMKGICDLTGVEIFEDRDRIYFKLTFRKLKSVSDTTNTWREAGLIALDTNPDKSDRICFYPLFNPEATVSKDDAFEFEVHFNSRWIGLLNERAELVDFRKNPKQVKNFVDWGRNSFVFSLPKEIVGEPTEKWKIGVGVGLTDDPRGRPLFYDVKLKEQAPNFYDVSDSNGISRESIYRKRILPMVRIRLEK